MKAVLYDSKGSKKSEIELPELFSSQIREDIASKFFEAEKQVQPYSNYPEAGKRHSASGTISKQRHKWKGSYGKGIARTPRKKMWRRGTQFYWIGAEVSNTRGGRVSHPPRAVYTPRKINGKEVKIAMNSGFAATAKKEVILNRYSSISEISSAPFVIESIPSKAKDAFSAVKKILGAAYGLALKKKEVRAGRGKTRGRKYKSNAGLLIISGKDEKIKLSGVEVKHLNQVKIADLYPLGRLALYTKQAIEQMEAKK
jgi:large subunit ribosomal protein L4e